MNNFDVDIDDEIITIGDEKQYFFFKAGGDIYALDAEVVSEMIEYQADITKVPLMPTYIKGVTNIRGEIFAVIDLMQRFTLPPSEISKKTSLVIIDKFALIIDEVHEVTSIKEDDIKSSLDFGFKIEQRFIKNMAYYNNEYIAILNIDEILHSKELSILKDDS